MNYLFIIFIGIIGLFYYNTFIWLVNSWLYNPYYSHGFLVPLISGFIIYKMRKDLYNIEKKQSQIGLIIFIIGIILQTIASMQVIRFLSGISLIITIYGILLFLFGNDFIEKMRFPILFLLLAVPIPFIDLVALPAQTLSAEATADIANLIGLNVERDGNILRTSAGAFEIALECSGLRSIISLLTIGIIYSFILEGSLIMKYIITLSSIPLAIIGNILRIVSVLLVANIYGFKTSIDYFHDFSSLLLFSITLVGLFLVGRGFGRLRFKKTF